MGSCPNEHGVQSYAWNNIKHARQRRNNSTSSRRNIEKTIFDGSGKIDPSYILQTLTGLNKSVSNDMTDEMQRSSLDKSGRWSI
jgi:hypothetical protein